MPRIVAKLSDLKLRQIRKVGRYADGAGLYVQVTGEGAAVKKSFVFRYMLRGRSREMGLGAYSEMNGLKEARASAAEARELCRQGVDPIAARRERMTALAAAEATIPTFEQCAKQFIETNKDGWKNAKHADQWASTLETYAYPIMGRQPVSDIGIDHVLKVLEQRCDDRAGMPTLWKGKTETASRVRGRIEKILDWAKTRKYRTGENPARWRGSLDSILPRKSKVRKVQHYPALPYGEIPGFMAELRAVDSTAARALEFTILTAARTNEVLGAALEEIDSDGRLWTVPAGRTKGGREHRVPLSSRAAAIVNGIARDTEAAHIFPGRKKGQSMSNMTLLKVLSGFKRVDAKGKAITTHGFRSSFRDWAAECTNFPWEVAEMAIAHAVDDKTEAAYRRGDLFQKRRRLMDEWARYCSAPATQAEVVPMMARG